MTTIVIEKNVLYTDSMHIQNKGIDATRNTKIALNASKTIAYAYTGVTLPALLLRRMVLRIEFEIVRRHIQCVIEDKPEEQSFHSVHELLNAFYEARGMKNWGFANCLALTRDEALHLDESAAIIVTADDYTGIGCYIPSYGVYRTMGLSPVESFGKIFDFACVSAGPVNMVHASSLLEFDVTDYIKQVKDRVLEPVLRAKVPVPVKKPTRRSPKTTQPK